MRNSTYHRSMELPHRNNPCSQIPPLMLSLFLSLCLFHFTALSYHLWRWGSNGRNEGPEYPIPILTLHVSKLPKCPRKVSKLCSPCAPPPLSAWCPFPKCPFPSLPFSPATSVHPWRPPISSPINRRRNDVISVIFLRFLFIEFFGICFTRFRWSITILWFRLWYLGSGSGGFFFPSIFVEFLVILCLIAMADHNPRD